MQCYCLQGKKNSTAGLNATKGSGLTAMRQDAA